MAGGLASLAVGGGGTAMVNTSTGMLAHLGGRAVESELGFYEPHMGSAKSSRDDDPCASAYAFRQV